MPTYQYECAKCGHLFEVFQSMKDNALDVCPKDRCAQKRWGRGKVQRQLGVGAGLIFKGSGFYITDYRSESYKAAAKKDSEGGSSAAKKPESSSSTSGSSGGSTSTKSESKPKPSAA